MAKKLNSEFQVAKIRNASSYTDCWVSNECFKVKKRPTLLTGKELMIVAKFVKTVKRPNLS